MTTRTIVPARDGRAVHVARGQRIRIVTPKGQQAADFFSYNAASVDEWLSPMHTWVFNRSIKPRPGQDLFSRFRRPMLRFVEDGADGVHDMMLAACDQLRYEQLGHEGPHPSCSENLMVAMRRLGYVVSVVPQPINFFTNTTVDAAGVIAAPHNPVPTGAFVELEALIDLICVVSSCPYDLTVNDWRINASSGPTELVIEVN